MRTPPAQAAVELVTASLDEDTSRLRVAAAVSLACSEAREASDRVASASARARSGCPRRSSARAAPRHHHLRGRLAASRPAANASGRFRSGSSRPSGGRSSSALVIGRRNSAARYRSRVIELFQSVDIIAPATPCVASSRPSSSAAQASGKANIASSPNPSPSSACRCCGPNAAGPAADCRANYCATVARRSRTRVARALKRSAWWPRPGPGAVTYGNRSARCDRRSFGVLPAMTGAIERRRDAEPAVSRRHANAAFGIGENPTATPLSTVSPRVHRSVGAAQCRDYKLWPRHSGRLDSVFRDTMLAVAVKRRRGPFPRLYRRRPCQRMSRADSR